MTPERREAFTTLWREMAYAPGRGVTFYRPAVEANTPILTDTLEEIGRSDLATWLRFVVSHRALPTIERRPVEIGPRGPAAHLSDREVGADPFPWRTWWRFQQEVFAAIAGKKKRAPVTPDPRRTIILRRLEIRGGYTRDGEYVGDGRSPVYEAIDRETGARERIRITHVTTSQRALAAVMLGIPNERLVRPVRDAERLAILTLARRHGIVLFNEHRWANPPPDGA